ncbi:MAG TPA: tetratricopeptide repeat protein, partial [Alphaproteobacteria bacterium]|nr:tetratricopeptide repeat protein [Alphaproteobacteria bacterium]
GLGDVWFNKKDLDQAKTFYARVLVLDPNNVPALNGLGDVWFNKKDLDQAKTFYARVLALDPNNVPALNGFRRCLV